MADLPAFSGSFEVVKAESNNGIVRLEFANFQVAEHGILNIHSGGAIRPGDSVRVTVVVECRI